MEQSNISEAVGNIPLFRECRAETLDKICSGKVLQYKPSEIIYSPENPQKKLIIITGGSAEVFSADGQKKILLRTLETGDMVGIANLFSDEPFVSNVIAKKACTALEIPQEDFRVCLKDDELLMQKYISLLSEKICYLNKKIICLTAGSAERRLAVYLDTISPYNSFSLPVSLTSLSEMLDLGRASLYRAFDRLENDGFIKREGKKIIILEREKMLQYYTI